MIKYKFNPKTLRFEEQKVAFTQFLSQKVLPKFASSVVLGIGLGIAATYYIGSPAENDVVEANLQQKEKFELLNKQFKDLETELAAIAKRDDNYHQIFQMEPVSANERRGGFGGVDKYAALDGFESSQLMKSTAERFDIIVNKMKVQNSSFEKIRNLVMDKEKMLASIPSIQPIAVKDLTRFGSPFGYRFHPILHIYRMHAGVDLTAPTGTPIYATGNGTVFCAGQQNGYGNVVKIDHGFGYTTVYGHMSKINVHEGQKVNRGDVIGLVGSTGLSTSPHCHYEVRINNKPVDPTNFYKNGMTEEEYQQLLDAKTNFGNEL